MKKNAYASDAGQYRCINNQTSDVYSIQSKLVDVDIYTAGIRLNISFHVFSLLFKLVIQVENWYEFSGKHIMFAISSHSFCITKI